MPPTCQRRTLERLRSDDGVGLILVIGMSAMMAILLAVITATAIRTTQSSRQHVSFEQSLAAAEAGIDTELSNIQTARNQVPSVNYESPVACRPAAPSSSVFASEASEKAWARSALAALPTSCTQTNAEGEYVSFKVPGRQVVYSLGWSPNRADPAAKERLLKAEYIFAPFRPGQAILTGGDLDFSGSVAVNAVGGAADVHTNADVVGANNSLQVSGSMTASGSLSSCPSGVVGGCQDSQPIERIPLANPRALYTDLALGQSQWYDLCNDGTVRSPSASGPCQGTVISGSPYRNWHWTAGTVATPGRWQLRYAGTSYPGVYYVYGANAVLDTNGNPQAVQTVTVLAEATYPSGYTNAATCNKYGGNISWKMYDIQNYIPGVLFIAQGSLDGNANSTAQSGLMLAGDRVDLKTSSATVKGSVIANNTCAAAGVNEIQGMTITYDQSVEAPVYSVVNTTLWLEYTG